MKMEVLQTMHPESGFWIPQNWPLIGKVTVASQFSDVTSCRFFLSCFAFLVEFSY